MRWFHSILFRVPLVLVLSGGAAVATVSLARLWTESVRLDEESKATLHTLALSIAVPLADSIWTYSEESKNLAMTALVDHPMVRRATLLDAKGKVLAVRGEPTPFGIATESLAVPVERSGEKLGELLIEIDETPIHNQLGVVRRAVLLEAIGLFLVVFSTLLGSLYSQILKKVRLLEEQSQMLYENKLDTPFRWHGKGELENLGRRLEHSRLEIRKQVEALADQKDKLLIRVEDLNAMVQRKSQEVVQSAKMASLGVMSSGIAHEINNPLAIIQLRAQRLKDLLHGLSDGDYLVKELEKIEETCERIAKIVRGLRTFSRASDGDPMAPVAIKQVFEDVLVLCKQKFSHGGVSLEVPTMEEVIVQGRAGELAQILMNLLTNAYDACENSPDPWVKLAVFQGEDEVEIRVMDSGPPVPKEIQEKLMQPFFTTKDPGKGTGLGLSISMGLARRMNGELKFERAEPTTFLIRLKRYKQKTLAA